MLSGSVRYFQKISLPYGDGNDRELGFVCRQNTHKATLRKQYTQKRSRYSAVYYKAAKIWKAKGWELQQIHRL